MKRLVSVVIGVVFLVGCSSSTAPSQPVGQFVTTPVPGAGGFETTVPRSGYPTPSVSQQAYPNPDETPESVDGRSRSALESYQLALQTAQQYNPDVRLYAIVPSTIMLGNLGNPPVLPGWFYKFKTEGSRREFYVQVVDRSVTGSTTAEPFEDVTPAEQPIDIEQVTLDSNQVLEQFKRSSTAQNSFREGVQYDLELVKLQGSKNPIWSVVDPSNLQWLYSVDAVTGEEVSNPRQ